jgi:hypothetical protein
VVLAPLGGVMMGQSGRIVGGVVAFVIGVLVAVWYYQGDEEQQVDQTIDAEIVPAQSGE